MSELIQQRKKKRLEHLLGVDDPVFETEEKERSRINPKKQTSSIDKTAKLKKIGVLKDSDFNYMNVGAANNYTGALYDRLKEAYELYREIERSPQQSLFHMNGTNMEEILLATKPTPAQLMEYEFGPGLKMLFPVGKNGKLLQGSGQYVEPGLYEEGDGSVEPRFHEVIETSKIDESKLKGNELRNHLDQQCQYEKKDIEIQGLQLKIQSVADRFQGIDLNGFELLDIGFAHVFRHSDFDRKTFEYKHWTTTDYYIRAQKEIKCGPTTINLQYFAQVNGKKSDQIERFNLFYRVEEPVKHDGRTYDEAVAEFFMDMAYSDYEEGYIGFLKGANVTRKYPGFYDCPFAALSFDHYGAIGKEDRASRNQIFTEVNVQKRLYDSKIDGPYQHVYLGKEYGPALFPEMKSAEQVLDYSATLENIVKEARKEHPSIAKFKNMELLAFREKTEKEKQEIDDWEYFNSMEYARASRYRLD